MSAWQPAGHSEKDLVGDRKNWKSPKSLKISLDFPVAYFIVYWKIALQAYVARTGVNIG
jgi:hypothetical protein